MSTTGVFASTMPPSVQTVTPSSVTSSWVTAIAAGGCDAISSARITDAAAVLAKTEQVVLSRLAGRGTHVAYRFRYRAADTTAGAVTVASLGRTGSAAPFERLYTFGGDDSVMITIDPTNDLVDSTDSAYRFTQFSQDDLFDCLGCEELVADLEGTDAVLGAGAAFSSLEAKLF